MPSINFFFYSKIIFFISIKDGKEQTLKSTKKDMLNQPIWGAKLTTEYKKEIYPKEVQSIEVKV